MSIKKLKKSKGSNTRNKRVAPDIDVQAGEGFYGIVEKILGGNIVSVKLNDNTIKQARIPGKFLKKVWIKPGYKVLLNLDLEIVHVIRDTDIKSAEADRMLRNAGNDGNNIFQYDSESESEEDEEVLIKKTENVDKIKEMMVKKEKDKLRDINRKGGKVMRDDDVIEKDIGDIAVIKKNDNNVAEETGGADEEINIDDI